MELTACSLEEPQLPQGRRGWDPQPRGSPRILSPDLVPRAGCLLPLEVPLRPLTKLPLADLSVAGHQERPDQGACRWPLEGPEASLSPTWTALAFSLVLLSPLWPPPVPLQPEATGKVPSPALASSPTVFSPPAVLHD